ncbi:hypothetical protein HG531_012257 [Fusarium graminearum]|nr:hypothetical protein HG531_012257 [Fusarium graminearum]
MTGKQGPIPEPVATRTTFLNRGAMARTPEAGVPRVQMDVGGFSMMRFVQSPALETTIEKPLPLGSGIAAKACHSTNGRSVMRTPRDEQGGGTTLTRRSLVQGRAMHNVMSDSSQIVGLCASAGPSGPVVEAAVETIMSANIPEVDVRSPLLSQSQGTRLTTDGDGVDVGEVFDVGHVLEDDGGCGDDGVAALETFRPGLETAASDVECAAVHHGNVELLRHIPSRSDAELGRLCQEGVGNTSVAHINTLGSTGSAGCVDDVCAIVSVDLNHGI